MYLSPIIKHDKVTLTLRSPMTGVFHYAKWTNTELSINFNCTAHSQNFTSHCNLDQKTMDHLWICSIFVFQHNFFIWKDKNSLLQKLPPNWTLDSTYGQTCQKWHIICSVHCIWQNHSPRVHFLKLSIHHCTIKLSF